QPLVPGAIYEIILTSAIHDLGANALANPDTTRFTAAPPPALALDAVQPPAARVGGVGVISGDGFAALPRDNHVLCGGIAAAVIGVAPGAVTVLVPNGAATGDVRVRVGALSSNALRFTVLAERLPPSDVLATIQVPTSGQRIVIVPDGSRAYMTSP